MSVRKKDLVARYQARRAKRTAKADLQKETRENAGTMDKTSNGAATILVVDDDDDIRFLLSTLLRREGYCVIEASSGEEAERAALNRTPRLILMDIGLPGLDGLSVVWRMRQHPEIAGVPVVVVSAYDSVDLRAEAAAEGCKGYLTKPLEAKELSSLVSEILQQENPTFKLSLSE